MEGNQKRKKHCNNCDLENGVSLAVISLPKFKKVAVVNYRKGKTLFRFRARVSVIRRWLLQYFFFFFDFPP
jgi:hypothetical protein